MIGPTCRLLQDLILGVVISAVTVAILALSSTPAEAKKPSNDDDRSRAASASRGGGSPRAAESRARESAAPRLSAQPRGSAPPAVHRSAPVPQARRFETPTLATPQPRRFEAPRSIPSQPAQIATPRIAAPQGTSRLETPRLTAPETRRHDPLAVTSGVPRLSPQARVGNANPGAVTKMATPQSASHGERSGVTEVRKRLDAERPTLPSVAGNREARSDGPKGPRVESSGNRNPAFTRATAPAVVGAKSMATNPPPGSSRSGTADVRKRLGEPRYGRQDRAAVGTPADKPATVVRRHTLPGGSKLDAASRIATDTRGPDAGRRLDARNRSNVTPQAGIGENVHGRTARDGGAASSKSRAEIREMANHRFSERLKSGQLDQVTKGQTAQTLKLSDQYRLAQHGDVARRLELQQQVGSLHRTNVNHVYVGRPYHHDNHYRGRIDPYYVRRAFEHRYHGPRFFAGICWYPTWRPWVDWSWHYRCHPIWDPRPFWCRPIIYEPSPVWVYYDVPVWTPLPVAASGTWVDVERPVLADND